MAGGLGFGDAKLLLVSGFRVTEVLSWCFAQLVRVGVCNVRESSLEVDEVISALFTVCWFFFIWMLVNGLQGFEISGVGCCRLGSHLIYFRFFNIWSGLLPAVLLSGMWIAFVWIHGCMGAMILDFWGRSEAD